MVLRYCPFRLMCDWTGFVVLLRLEIRGVRECFLGAEAGKICAISTFRAQLCGDPCCVHRSVWRIGGGDRMIRDAFQALSRFRVWAFSRFSQSVQQAPCTTHSRALHPSLQRFLLVTPRALHPTEKALFRRRLRKQGSLCVQVLLLCGAPGLGKTTLAHVAAQHCGYRVVEVRAWSLKAALSSRLRNALLLFNVFDGFASRESYISVSEKLLCVFSLRLLANIWVCNSEQTQRGHNDPFFEAMVNFCGWSLDSDIQMIEVASQALTLVTQISCGVTGY